MAFFMPTAPSKAFKAVQKSGNLKLCLLRNSLVEIQRETPANTPLRFSENSQIRNLGGTSSFDGTIEEAISRLNSILHLD